MFCQISLWLLCDETNISRDIDMIHDGNALFTSESLLFFSQYSMNFLFQTLVKDDLFTIEV